MPHGDKKKISQLSGKLREIVRIAEGALEDLGKEETAPVTRATTHTERSTTLSTPDVDFSESPRALVKHYGKGMGGKGKYTFLVAIIAKGSEKKDVSNNEVKKLWEKMTGTLGKFNSAAATRADDHGLLGSRGHGTHHLTKRWRQIFK